MIIPYHVDVPMQRVPVMNFGLIAVTVLAFGVFLFGGAELDEELVVNPWVVWAGHLVLHGGLFHLLGNMIFLWVFGNAVCAKVGNLAYPIIYWALGLVALLVHQLIDGDPVIGASGAINGIVGMYVVWYARNEISCFYWLFNLVGVFHISSFWMIAFWFVFDVLGAVAGEGGVAYWAHLGGFAAGFALAILLLKTGAVEMGRGEQSLFGAGEEPEW